MILCRKQEISQVASLFIHTQNLSFIFSMFSNTLFRPWLGVQQSSRPLAYNILVRFGSTLSTISIFGHPLSAIGLRLYQSLVGSAKRAFLFH